MCHPTYRTTTYSWALRKCCSFVLLDKLDENDFFLDALFALFTTCVIDLKCVSIFPEQAKVQQNKRKEEKEKNKQEELIDKNLFALNYFLIGFLRGKNQSLNLKIVVFQNEIYVFLLDKLI